MAALVSNKQDKISEPPHQLPLSPISEKARKKASGKARSVQIAVERLSLNKTEEDDNKAHSGHGSHNAARSRLFVKFLLDTFNRKETLHSVLDVAGGNGEVSLRLSYCHHIKNCTMVDIREANLISTLRKRVINFLPKKWKERLIAKTDDELFEEATCFPQQVTTPFNTLTQVEETPILFNLVQNSGLLIGMHADASTEAIVDLALKYSISFAVVPCYHVAYSQIYSPKDW